MSDAGSGRCERLGSLTLDGAKITSAAMVMTRPLRAYPQRAKYVKGDTADAKSFACEAGKT